MHPHEKRKPASEKEKKPGGASGLGLRPLPLTALPVASASAAARQVSDGGGSGALAPCAGASLAERAHLGGTRATNKSTRTDEKTNLAARQKIEALGEVEGG